MGSKIWALFKLYLWFAGADVLVKVLRKVLNHVRASLAWRKVPGDLNDVFGIDLAKNVRTLNVYLAKKILDHPGATMSKRCLPRPAVTFHTPHGIEWMLKTEFKNVTKPQDGTFMLMREFLGKDGIFVVRHGTFFPDANKLWERQRKLGARIFTKSNFSTFMHKTFTDKSKRAIQVIKKRADSGEYIDMQDLFFCFTMDSIENFFFGNDVNSVGGKMSDYATYFDTAHREMLLLLTDIIVPLAVSEIAPFPFNYPILLAARKASPHEPLFKQAVQNLHDHIDKYVNKIRDDKDIASRTDLISFFIRSCSPEEMQSKEFDRLIRDVVLNFTIAGRDTTACTLSWMFYRLSQEKDVGEKLYEEIRNFKAGKGHDFVPSVEDLSAESMPYLNGVLYETLRLYPAVPNEQKTAMKDLWYPNPKTGEQVFIPKGSELCFCPYALGKDPEYFKDPLTFDPTRWIPFKDKELSMFEFPVFQAGYRFCLGKDMAIFEAKLVSFMLLSNFEFKLKPGEKEHIREAFMLTMAIENRPEPATHNLWMKPLHRN